MKANTYHDSLALISYNLDFVDTAVANMRERFYPVNLIHPKLFVDGAEAPGNDSTAYVNTINAARSVSPKFNLALDAQATATDGSVHLTVITADSFLTADSFETDDSMFVFIAVCQDSVDGLLKDFNYICRQFYYFPIPLPYPDSLDTTITFTHSYPVDKLHAVAFVQTLVSTSKKVHQAATAPFVSSLP